MDTLPYIKYSVTSSDSAKINSSPSSSMITIDKNLALGNFNIAFSLLDKQLSGKWVLELDNPEILGYFAFMLNDPMTLKRILGSNITRGKKYRVSKSMISSLKIPMGDMSLIKYYSLIENYFQQIYYNEEKDDISLLKLDIFSSIRLALSFELHQYNIMQDFKICILTNWKNLVDQIGYDLNALFDNIMLPDNLLLNNVKRFQLLLSSFQQVIQNGLEAK